MSQEWNKEGASGVWKGANTTFVYGLAWTAVESFAGGLASGVLDVPYLGLVGGKGYLSVGDSPNPWASLAVAIIASVSAGIVLAPLDMIRTK